MGRRTVKVIVVVLDPRAFCALMVTWRLVTDCVGVPDTTPELELSCSPEGSDPEEME